MDSEIHPKAAKNSSIEKYNDAASRMMQIGFFSAPVEPSWSTGLREWVGGKRSRQHSAKLALRMALHSALLPALPGGFFHFLLHGLEVGDAMGDSGGRTGLAYSLAPVVLKL